MPIFLALAVIIGAVYVYEHAQPRRVSTDPRVTARASKSSFQLMEDATIDDKNHPKNTAATIEFFNSEIPKWTEPLASVFREAVQVVQNWRDGKLSYIDYGAKLATLFPSSTNPTVHTLLVNYLPF
jgi:hypothetical protein